MGFFSKVVDTVGGFVGDVFDGLTGKSASDASREAAGVQSRSADKSIDFARESRDIAREDLEPFVKFGNSALTGLQALFDPQNEYDFLVNSPIRKLALEDLNKSVMSNQALRGKLDSGGTLDALNKGSILTSIPLLDSRKNSLTNAVNIGQSSAAGQANTTLSTGNTLSNVALQQGNAIASGIVGSQNARQEGFNNLANLGIKVFGGGFGA